MSGMIKRLAKHRKIHTSLSTVRVNRPDWMGSLKPDIVFVVDPLVGAQDADEAPNAKTPISKGHFEYLKDRCRDHGIDIKNAAVIRACPPVTAEVWDSQKRMGDHLKVHREEFSANVIQASPRVIVALGKNAASQVMGRAVKITQARGMPTKSDEYGCMVFPSLGLSHVIRIPENFRTFDSDFATLKKIVDTGFKQNYQTKLATDYKWCTNLKPLIALAKKGRLDLSVDIEGLGLRYYDPATRVLTVQITTEAGNGIAVPIDYDHVYTGPRDPSKYWTKPHSLLQRKRLVAELKELLENPNVFCMGQNFKFDYLFLLHKLGITVANYEDDTICLVHAVDENMLRKDLDEITRQWVPDMAGYADAFNRDPVHRGKSRMDLVPPDKMLAYGCGDTDATWRSKQVLEAKLKEDAKAYGCYKQVVMPGLRAFAQIEDHGFVINKKALKEFETMLRKHQTFEYKKLKKMVPASIRIEELDKHEKRERVKDPETGKMVATGKILKQASITRPGFLRSMLFTHKDGLQLEPIVFTKSTAKLKDHSMRVPSTSGKMHLAYFENDHPFIAGIMEYIKNEKLLGTYVGTEDVEEGGSIKGFYKYLFDGRIRPTYLLHRTVTGRTASADPNGQNFPKRGKLAKKYREIFVAPPGYVLLEVDFSQLELRIAAIMSRDPVMLRLYREGKDIHTATACAVMGITVEQFYELPKDEQVQKRFQAKAVNFGFLYGMGWRKFMNYARTDYGVTFTEEEAQNIRKTFFKLYKNLKLWHDNVIEFVSEHGYVRTYDGRVRHLPSVFSPDEGISHSAQRQAINSPVQAFGSDLGLMAMAKLVKAVDFSKVRPIGFIHDAIVCLAPEAYAKEAARAIKHHMETVDLKGMFGFVSPIPILAEASVGKTLANMIEVSDEWLADDKLDDWHSIAWHAHREWKGKYDKAVANGVEEKKLPKHPLGDNWKADLPRRSKVKPLVRRRPPAIKPKPPIRVRPMPKRAA